MNAEQYKRYLLSSHWKEKSLECLERYKRSCVICGKRSQHLHVHHLHYRNVGHEKKSDLVVLCNRHHEEIHKLPDGYDADGVAILQSQYDKYVLRTTFCPECQSEQGAVNDNSCEFCGSRLFSELSLY